MVSFQLLLNSQQGPHFRTNSKIFLHTARLNSVNECFKFNDGCIDWEIDIMKRRFRTERVDFYFWLFDGKPINKWHTFSLGGLHLQDHREAWLSFSQPVELQLQHQLTQHQIRGKSPKSIAKWLPAFSRPLQLFHVFTLGPAWLLLDVVLCSDWPMWFL